MYKTTRRACVLLGAALLDKNAVVSSFAGRLQEPRAVYKNHKPPSYIHGRAYTGGAEAARAHAQNTTN